MPAYKLYYGANFFPHPSRGYFFRHKISRYLSICLSAACLCVMSVSPGDDGDQHHHHHHRHRQLAVVVMMLMVVAFCVCVYKVLYIIILIYCCIVCCSQHVTYGTFSPVFFLLYKKTSERTTLYEHYLD